MFATDKTDGLYVHDLDGSVRQFLPSGALNNVEIRTGFSVGRRDDMVLVAATNDSQMGINVYLFDPRTLETRDYGFIVTDMGEPYSFCMGRREDGLYLMANNKLGGHQDLASGRWRRCRHRRTGAHVQAALAAGRLRGR